MRSALMLPAKAVMVVIAGIVLVIAFMITGLVILGQWLDRED